MPNTVVDLYGTSPNAGVTVLPSAARTANPNTIEYQNAVDVCGLIVVVNVTAITSTPSITVKIQGVDQVSGQTWDILTSAAITAVSGAGAPTVLRVAPGITAVANQAASDLVPGSVRITVTHSNANSITYSVAAQFIYC